MTVEHMATVLHHSRSGGTDKLILLGIANHDGDGGAWPTLATLSKYANVDERSVRRAIKRLVELGEVRVLLNAGGTRETRADRRPNRYEILVRCPQDCDGGPQHRSRGAVLVEPDAGPGDGDSDGRTLTPSRLFDGVAPASSRGDHGGTPTSERGDASVTYGGTPTSPEPSLEPSMNQPLASTASPPPPKRERDEVWDALLDVCGLTDVSPTGSARGAWNRARRELGEVGATPDEIRARAGAYRRRWPGASLTPNALARRWAECVAAPPPTSPMPGGGHVAPPRPDRVAMAAGAGRNLARTDLPAEELGQHVPRDLEEGAAFRAAFLEERACLDARRSA